jgi:hypothetical protein
LLYHGLVIFLGLARADEVPDEPRRGVDMREGLELLLVVVGLRGRDMQGRVT